MSKKSVGDREHFIKGLINEAVWLLRVFMHTVLVVVNLKTGVPFG